MPEKEKYTNVHTENSDQVESTPVNQKSVDETIKELPEAEALQLTDMWNTFKAAFTAFRKLAGL